jgi:hypothetical protein
VVNSSPERELSPFVRNWFERGLRIGKDAKALLWI